MNRPATSGPIDLEGAALRTFVRIAEAWQLTEEDQRKILALPEAEPWQPVEELPVEGTTLLRISYIISIYRILHTIFSDRSQADGWVHRSNSAEIVGGRTAIQVLCSGELRSFESIRDHLAAQQG